jgi:prepilin-type N-terminal cleavage/methylation domain-containing protein
LIYKGDDEMNQKEKGFTLVEMIVTMAVLSILLSVSVFGLIAWQENARFTQQNEYAQTLFVAAQNQMTEYSRNGILERFQTKITDAGGSYERVLDVTGLTDGQGNIYTKDQVWYEGSDKGNNASRYQGELCYVSCKAGDYELYKSGNLGSAGRSRGADVLFELLSNYVYDQSILNNSISVEFSPDEGQIFAVCFSDEGSEFIYDEPSNTATSGLVNIANREESYRKGYMVGYYGTDTLARSTSATSKKPMLAKVKLNNEETLNLSFRVLKVSGAAQQLKYNLDVYDKDTKRMMLSLVVDGSQIHNYETRSTVQSAVTRYVYDADGKQTVQELGDYDILAWIEEDETIRIVLDAADIQATTIGYLSDLKNADAGLKGVNAASTDFASTYSFHRFGIDADNIYCTVQGSGGNYKTTAMKQSNSESVYFATANVSVSTDKETSLPVYDYSYTIGNGRHLYNVRFVEDLSASEQNEYSDAIDSSQITNRFEVSKDIDWNDFVASGNLYYTRAGMVSLTDTDNVTINQIKGAEGSLCARVLLQCDFPSIKQLRYGDTFTGNSEDGKDSENKEIAGLSICETSNVLCSVYTVYNDASLPLSEIFENNSEGESLAETEENSEENSAESYLEDERPVGLFVNNFGTISKLCLDRITVEGNRKVGAFCGENGGNLTKLEVKSSDEDNPSTVTGMENVGGIMGYQRSINDAELYDGTAQTPELCELTNRAKITGIKYVGGIVGEIYVPDNEEQPAITIENCKNYGAITARNSEKYEGSTETEAKTEPRYLGGIVGYCHNEYVDENNQVDMEHLKVVECISSPEYSEEDLDLLLERNTGDGDDSVGQITDKNYTGENLRGVYVGGIVGYNYFGTIENCSAEAESGKTGYIFGYQYVGGIVGFNQGPASGIKGGSDSSDKGVNENNVVGYQYVGGISGCNSDILYKEDSEDPDLDDYDVIQPNPETNLNVKISNWENRGVIFALDSYAGGITGYNAGWLYDCDSKVRNNETGGFFQETYSGDYAGGISGYNNGTIGKTDREILADGTSGDVISRYSGDATTI